MSEFYQTVRMYFTQVCGPNGYLVLWILSLGFCFFMYKKQRHIFFYPFLIVAIILVNPITGRLMLKYLDGGYYARIAWCFLANFMIAIASVSILGKIRDRFTGYVLTLMILFSLGLAGTFIFNADNFSKATNFYKLSDETLAIADRIIEMRHKDDYIIVTDELVTEVRQYDSHAILVYGRYGTADVQIETYLNASDDELYWYFTDGPGRIAKELILPITWEEAYRDRLYNFGWVRDTRMGKYDVYERMEHWPIWHVYD